MAISGLRSYFLVWKAARELISRYLQNSGQKSLFKHPISVQIVESYLKKTEKNCNLHEKSLFVEWKFNNLRFYDVFRPREIVLVKNSQFAVNLLRTQPRSRFASPSFSECIEAVFQTRIFFRRNNKNAGLAGFNPERKSKFNPDPINPFKRYFLQENRGDFI